MAKLLDKKKNLALQLTYNKDFSKKCKTQIIIVNYYTNPAISCNNPNT